VRFLLNKRKVESGVLVCYPCLLFGGEISFVGISGFSEEGKRLEVKFKFSWLSNAMVFCIVCS